MSRQPSVPARQPAALRRGLLFALLGLCALGHAANANTLTVPGQYQTIQDAISAASNGDTVLLADGTYNGRGNVDVDFGGKNLTVTSQHGAAKTIIDCGGYSSSDGSGDHRGFVLQSGETKAVIRGLTIQNGYVSGIGYGEGGGYSDGNGGDIEVVSAGVTVQNCVLQNSTAKFGGGLLNFGGTATLTNCALTGDTALQGGGGIYNVPDNQAYESNGKITLTNCVLTGDMAQFGGGLANTEYGTATLTNCALTGDTSQGFGGGLYNSDGGTATLTNDTLTGNSAQYGGGLDNDSGGTVRLTNDILYGDTAPSGEVLNDQTYGSSTASASHCDIAGGVPSNVTDGGGNINADPKFVNPPTAPQFASPAVGDLHLRPGSPCIGAGTAKGAPRTDKDGTVRPNPPSIGAYEPGSTLNVPTQYATIQAAIKAAHPDNTVLLADGTYRGTGNVDVDFLGKSITVTSQDGASKTVIDCGGFSSSDGSGDHRGFILKNGETNAVISGLTIQNGYESGKGGGDGQGGGIEVSGAGISVIVQNCVLQNDTAQYGGGLYNDNGYMGMATVTGCTLTGDTAQYNGGGLDNGNGGTLTLTNSALTGDTAQQYGGGLANDGTATLTHCALTGDTAYAGGGLENGYTGTATLTGCTLTGNSAQYGGGLENGGNGGSLTLTNCALAGNSAQHNGGGLDNDGAATLTNCTFTGNSAQQGGGIENFNEVGLGNDILYGDTAPNGGEVDNSGDGVASHCDIAGGVPSALIDDGGNINADPLFVNPPADLHLQPGSPCLGAGTPNGAPTTTLDGYPRPNPPSIGAFELEPAFRVYVVNATGPAGQTVLLSAALTRPGGVGLVGATLTFSVDGMAAGSAVTNKDGDASVHYAVPLSLSVGSHTITASFAGDGTNPASSGTATLTVTAARRPNSVVTVGERSGKAGTTVVLKATLKTPSGAALAGRTLTYTVNGVSAGSAVTDSTGLASLTYAIPAGTPAGGAPIVVSFAGDGGDAPSSGKGTLTVK